MNSDQLPKTRSVWHDFLGL